MDSIGNSQKGFGHVLILVTAVVLGITAVIGYSLYASSGHETRPTPITNQTLAADKKAAVAQTEVLFADVQKGLQTVAAPTTGSDDLCNYGEHGWKRNDPYDVHCAYRQTKFYGFNTDFRQTILNLHKTLLASGWTVYERDSLALYITEYYDSYYGKTDYGHVYLVSDLPEVSGGYQKNGFEVRIDYAEQATRPEDAFSYIQDETPASAGYTEYYTAAKPADAKRVFNDLRVTNKFVVAIAISSAYYAQ